MIELTVELSDSKINQKRRKKKKRKNVVFQRAIAEGEALESQRLDADY